MSEAAAARVAEELLFDLAALLRFVPLTEQNRLLHLRALELKRRVRGWSAREPAADEARAVVAEIDRLVDEARRARAAAARAGGTRATPRPWSIDRPCRTDVSAGSTT